MRRKVLLVSPSISRDGGGVSESVRLLASALHATDLADIEITTLNDAHLRADIHLSNVPVRASKIMGPKRYGFSPGLLIHLFRAKPDLVHVHGLWMFHCLAVYVWSLITRRPYVLTPHGMFDPWILNRSRGVKGIVRSLYQDKFVSSAAAVHCLTSREAQEIGSLSSACEIIPNYVRTPPAVVHQKLESSASKTFLFFGRIHEKKGWKELISAWDVACRASEVFRSSCSLVYAGWIDGKSEFEEEVVKLDGVHGNVKYIGPQFGDAKTSMLRSAHFLVLPSKGEGLPMVILEAWAFGVPAIMTAECNLKVGFERGAALQTTLDPASLSSALLSAGSLSALQHEAMADAARALVAEQFSESIVTSAFLSLYNRVSPAQGETV